MAPQILFLTKGNKNNKYFLFMYNLSCAHDLQLKQFYNNNSTFFPQCAARLKALNGIERFISTKQQAKTRFLINQPSNDAY